MVVSLMAQCYRNQGVEELASRTEKAVICAKLSTTKADYAKCLKE